VKTRLAATALTFGLTASLAVAQAPQSRPARVRPTFASQPASDDALAAARSELYKRVGDVELKLHIFNPPGHKPTDRRPAIVFFFGGGWTHGSAGQFVPQCRYLASRGMVAITADYRVYARDQARVADCVSDAQAAIRWVRTNAKRLGIDPDRIAAGGGSAGGHLAAATAMLKDFTGEKDATVSFRPNALILFNPALDLTPIVENEKREARWRERLGADVKDLSPALHVKPGTPPTIIFHGKADRLIPYPRMEAFAKTMKAAGNRCELVGFEGQGHGFFNYRPRSTRYFTETLRSADQFLVSLGYLSGMPTTDAYDGASTTRPE